MLRSSRGASVILLVEDNPGDQKLVALAFRDNPRVKSIHVVDDGEKALAFLRRSGEFKESPRPDLILLDLNLPRKSGFEVLEELRADPQLVHMPVVVLTSSEAPWDVHRSYRLGANAFLTKPVDLPKFLEAMQGIDGFWLRQATLPGWDQG